MLRLRALKKSTAMLLCIAMIVTLFAGLTMTNVFAAEVGTIASEPEIILTDFGGRTEAAYVEWQNPTEVSAYNVYVSPENGNYTKIDNELIRYYGTYYRADIPGLAAGRYKIKVAADVNGTEKSVKETDVVTVKAHAREGYAFDAASPYKTASGGYNDDGTVPDDAQIIYITKDTVNTVELDVIQDAKGSIYHCTGLTEILKYRAKKDSKDSDKVPYDKRHLIIRFIGKVSDADISGLNSSGYLEVKDCANITLEGIGVDATIYGWGILVRQAKNIEIRNIGVLQFQDDGISLDTENYNIWVHNCDIFYGRPGSAKDQVKGDGSLDVKSGSDYCSFSYNHFWDSGKCSLCGMKADSYQGYHMTYHHNWFDHSDSRHPRIRGDQVHIYNNYYDGNSKYGVGSCTGSQVFVENNYFRNVKFPVLISKQGSDVKYTDGGKGTFSGEDGGMIKMFGNVLNGGHDVVDANSEPIEFDAYIAKSREEQVPSTFKAKQGGTTYNNFDTNGLYSYNVDDANYVPDIVMSNAGRIDGGDLKWDFDDAVEDTNDQIIPELNNAVKGYESTLINAAGVTGFYPETTNGTPPTARPTDVPIPTAGPTLKPGETPVPTNTPEPTQAPIMANPTVWDFGMAPFTITDGDAVHPDTNYFPQNAADKERYDLKNTSINPENFGGLKHTTGSKPEGQYQKGGAEFEDGFKGTWQIKSNGGSFSFIPVVDGTVKVYAKHGSTDTTKPVDNVTIIQGTNSQKLQIAPGAAAPYKVLTMGVVAGQTVTISADQNTGYYAISYTSDKPVPTMPPATATPVPANDDYAITDTAIADNGIDVTVTYSGSEPAPGGILIAAKYDVNGALTDFKQGPPVNGAGTYTVEGFKPSADDNYRIYLWNSLDDIKPLCNAYINKSSIVSPTEPTTVPTEPTEAPSDPTKAPDPTQAPIDPDTEILWSFAGSGSIAGTIDLGSGLSFIGKSSSYDKGATVDEIKFENRIKLGGKSTFTAGKESRIFTFTPASAGTLTIYFVHGSPKDVASNTRNLIVYQGGDKPILTVPAAEVGKSASVNVAADAQVVIGSDDNIGFYGIRFTPTK